MTMLDTLKALADPSRLRLVAVLLRGEFTVQELTRILAMGQSRISRHLKILTEAGVLSVKRQGTWSYYRAGGESAFFDAIRPAFERELNALPERSRDLSAVAAVLEERRRRSQEFFDRHADQWDDLAGALLPVPEYRQRLLELVPGSGTVLEIGVGTGGLLVDLGARAARVIGVDHSPAMLEEARRRHTDVVLDIDVQGARQLKDRIPDAISIFILAPSRDELEQRRRARSEDAQPVIDRRLREAAEEIRNYDRYDYVIVNRQIEESAAVLAAIVRAERARRLPAAARRDAAEEQACALAASARRARMEDRIRPILATFEIQKSEV
jgi:DNA-binding transcriptional ArsR family regulator